MTPKTEVITAKCFPLHHGNKLNVKIIVKEKTVILNSSEIAQSIVRVECSWHRGVHETHDRNISSPAFVPHKLSSTMTPGKIKVHRTGLNQDTIKETTILTALNRIYRASQKCLPIYFAGRSHQIEGYIFDTQESAYKAFLSNIFQLHLSACRNGVSDMIHWNKMSWVW